MKASGVGPTRPAFCAGTGYTGARAALLNTAPALAWFANEGVTADGSHHVSAVLDQSGNSHSASVGGTGVIISSADAGGYMRLLYPATGAALVAAGAVPASTNMIFAFRYVLGDAPGAATEVIWTDGTRWLAVNYSSGGGLLLFFDGTSQRQLAPAMTGKHDVVVVANATGGHVTAYIDGVAQTPATYAPAAWATTVWAGGLATTGAPFPLVSGSLYIFCYWPSVAQAANIIAAFDSFSTLAFGPHA